MGIELTVDDTRIEFRRELILKDLPERMERGKFYKFDINGYVVFPLGRAMRLFIEGSSEQIASIEITEQTNYLLGGLYHTHGEYFVRVCAINKTKKGEK